jgi:hypothetical protein
MQDSDTRWIDNIPSTLYGVFTEVFRSYAYGTVKIFSIDYTMLDQYLNKTSADWVPQLNSLSGVSMDGNLSTTETGFSSYDVVFGGGYDATVYTRANATHVYYGIQMDNYTVGDDAFGLQIAPEGSTSTRDIRVVNYEGNQFYDGHLDYYGNWAEDTHGANSTEFATGQHVIEFMVPLNSSDPQDVALQPGMNYQIKFMFWNHVDRGEPTLDSDWVTIWVPVELH